MRITRILAVILAVASPLFAASNRVFVRSTGMDTGTCPITSPCRSFSYAMTQVSAGGEVIALDTAGYGTFTVSQSVSVFAAPGATAFIAVASGAGISINAAATDSVILRGLALTANGGAVGIDFLGGLALSVENSIVNGFTSVGIQAFRTTAVASPTVHIDHCTIRFNNEGVLTGVLGAGSPQGGPPPATVGLTVSNSSFDYNSDTGLWAVDNTRAAVSDTIFHGNSSGAWSGPYNTLSHAELSLERCTISSNGTGVGAGLGYGTSPQSIVRIARNLITGNANGIVEFADGVIQSMSAAGSFTNTIEGNASNGTASGTYTAK
jgi:hypothetical protein